MRSPAEDTPEQSGSPAAAPPEASRPEPVAPQMQRAAPEPVRGRVWARPLLVGALAGLIAAGSLGAAYAIGQATDDDPLRGAIARGFVDRPGMLPGDRDLPGPRERDARQDDGGPARSDRPGDRADRPGDRDMERERLRDRDADCLSDDTDDESEDADSGTS